MKNLKRRAAELLESHVKSVLGMLMKFATGIGLAAVALGAAGLAITLPALGVVTVTIVGGYVIIKKGAQVLFKSANTDEVKSWLSDNS